MWGGGGRNQGNTRKVTFLIWQAPCIEFIGPSDLGPTQISVFCFGYYFQIIGILRTFKPIDNFALKNPGFNLSPS